MGIVNDDIIYKVMMLEYSRITKFFVFLIGENTHLCKEIQYLHDATDQSL